MLEALREGVIYEAVASLRLPEGCHPMPLGIERRGGLLYASLYPGSRAYSRADSLECIAAALPADPLDYARVLLGEAEPRHHGLCCPLYSSHYIAIEARVEGLEGSEGDVKRLTLRPTRILLGEHPEPFNRLASCMVELLVAYTRIRYWPSCTEKLREYHGIERCLDLLERRAVGDYRRYYSRVKTLIERLVEPCLGHAPG